MRISSVARYHHGMGTPESVFFESMKQAEKLPDNEGAAVMKTPNFGDEEQPSANVEDKDGIQFTHPVMKALHKGREELLSRLFDVKDKSDAAEQSAMSQKLDHARTGDFETSSPQLSSKSKVKIAEVPPTLGDLVKAKLGRF